MSKLRFLTHRLLTGRTFSIAIVGASLTLLSACGSTAADLAQEVRDRDERERIAAAAEKCAGTPPSVLDPECVNEETGDSFLAITQVNFPEAPETAHHGRMAPFVNGADGASRSDDIHVFSATGLFRPDLTGENRGVSNSITGQGTGAPGQIYDFVDLHLARFSPVPQGAEAKNSGGKDDVPFLLIWQFADAKEKDDKRFIAPGIERFRFVPPEGEDGFPPHPRNRAQYLNNILGSIGNDSNDQEFPDGTPGDAPSDNEGEPSQENPRPLPYAGAKRVTDFPGGSSLSQIRLSGSSNLWSTVTQNGDAITVDPQNDRDELLPRYDVELTFPNYHVNRAWSLRYSGFIMMRAFYKNESTQPISNILAGGAPRSYINLFAYTDGANPTNTDALVKRLYDGNKAATGERYKGAFFAYGVAQAKQNEHHRLIADNFYLTAIFHKSGGGTLTGGFTPKYAKAGGDADGVNADTEFSAEEPWGGSDNPRTIKLEKVQWTGFTGAGVEFKGNAVVYNKDGTAVAVYDDYASGGRNFENFKGRFGGPEAEELVAEWKLRPKANDPSVTNFAGSPEAQTPTYLGGLSAHRYKVPTTP